MNKQQAYKELDLPPNSTPEEIKKKYKTLAKAHHPDLNKEPGAEDKFKKINRAYEIVSGKSPANPRSSPFSRAQPIEAENIDLYQTISFQEAVLGCSKEIKISRKTKCKECDGAGITRVNNGCTQCQGKGQVISRQGSMIMAQTCNKCYGKSETITCKICQGQCILDVISSVNVAIPGGITDGNVLRLSNMGHYVGNFLMMDQFTDAHLHLTVLPLAGLSIDGKNVINILSLSLLEALQGCQKEVPTIKGSRTIIVPPASRHKEEVSLPNLGVSGKGDQKVVLHVAYPNDLDSLKVFLETLCPSQ